MAGAQGHTGAWQHFVGYWVGAPDTDRIAAHLADAPEHIRAALLKKVNCASLCAHVESLLRQRRGQLSLLQPPSKQRVTSLSLTGPGAGQAHGDMHRRAS